MKRSIGDFVAHFVNETLRPIILMYWTNDLYHLREEFKVGTMLEVGEDLDTDIQREIHTVKTKW